MRLLCLKAGPVPVEPGLAQGTGSARACTREPHLDGTADSLALLRWGGCEDL